MIRGKFVHLLAYILYSQRLLFELLLGTKLVGVTALLLAAVVSTGVQTSVAAEKKVSNRLRARRKI